MKLKNLLKKIEIDGFFGNKDDDLDIDKISIHSADIDKNTIFVATKGTVIDSHTLILDIIKKKCPVIICEEILHNHNVQSDTVLLKVKCSKTALGQLCKNFYDDPCSKLKLVGITGTNGKTTTAHILYNTFLYLGYKVGLISTIHNIINKEATPSSLTTPGTLEINKLLYNMVKEGCQYCFMEVSSHAIVQKRIEGLKFAGGVFLNISQDHLDYHKSFKNYIYAKKLFFDKLSIDAFSLYNRDDRNGYIMVQNTKSRKYSYGLQNNANFNIKIISKSFEFLELEIDQKRFHTQFYGDFNAYNFLAAYSTAKLLQEKTFDILLALSKVIPPKGRFNLINTNKGSRAVIDYAHTPDAVEKILKYLSQTKHDNSKIITVIGCGGDRDKTKRSLMGKIASRYSYITILTSDNPRSENPTSIIKDMITDIIDKSKIFIYLDRGEAIKKAYDTAKKEDIILIAGKGHENYQIIGKKKSHFDDYEVIEKLNRETH